MKYGALRRLQIIPTRHLVLSLALLFAGCGERGKGQPDECSLVDGGPDSGPTPTMRVASEKGLPICDQAANNIPTDAELEWIVRSELKDEAPLQQEYEYGGARIRLTADCVTAWTYPGCRDIPYLHYTATLFDDEGQSFAVIPSGQWREVTLPDGRSVRMGNGSSGEGIQPDSCSYCGIGIVAQANLFLLVD